MKKLKNDIKKFLLKIYYILPEASRESVYGIYMRVIKRQCYVKYKLIDMKQCTKTIPLTITEKGETTYIYRYIPEYREVMAGESDEKEEVILPERYIVRLADVEIHGEQSFILQDNICVDDLQYMYAGLQYVRNKEIIKDNKEYIWIRKWNQIEQIEKGIFLVGLGSNNYYHLTIEILSKLVWIDELTEYRDVPILIDESVGRVSQYLELVETVNIWKRPIIFIKPDRGYNVKQLICASPNSWIPFNIRINTGCDYRRYLFSEKSLKKYRECIMESVTGGKVHRKIYVSRKNVVFQRLENEADIEKIFEQAGFEIIYPERLSFKQQVKLFSEAKYIAGMSGAAMTNLIYVQQESVFITFVDHSNMRNLYPQIARMLNITCHLLPAHISADACATAAAKYKVDLAVCKEYLRLMFA